MVLQSHDMMLRWGDISDLLEESLAYQCRILETETDPAKIYRTQGDVRSIRYMLDLPLLLKSRRESLNRPKEATE